MYIYVYVYMYIYVYVYMYIYIYNIHIYMRSLQKRCLTHLNHWNNYIQSSYGSNDIEHHTLLDNQSATI